MQLKALGLTSLLAFYQRKQWRNPSGSLCRRSGRCRVKTRTIEEAMMTQGLPLDHWSDASPTSYLR